MAETELYSLEFLFDGSQIDEDRLRKQAAKAIDLQRDSSMKITIEELTTATGTRCLKLSIRGTLEEVDRCHQKLVNAQLVRRGFCILLLDEPGAKIRERAYPFLARIETRLRTFINRAMTEIIGFDWWENMVPQQVRERVQQVEEKAQRGDLDRYHPLEHAYFDDLLLVVTGIIQRWTEEKSLSAADLQELLAEASSIQEVREKVAERTRKISLWDEVFTHYFQKEEHKEQWRDLQGIIQEEVILRRHRVMHHRAMHFWELGKLEEIEQGVNALIDSAKSQLAEEERVEVRKTSAEWLDTLSEVYSSIAAEAARQNRELIDKVYPSIAAEAARQYKELARTIGKAVSLPTLMKLAQQRKKTAASGEFSANLVASTRSNRFHLFSCRYAQRISSENYVSFASREDAVAQGYDPCEICEP